MNIILPPELWIKIYEYEGLFYVMIDKVNYELKLIFYQTKCHKCNLRNINNGNVCPVHWHWFKDSLQYLKKNKMGNNLTRMSNGIWIWNDVVIPKWIYELKNKIYIKKLKKK